MNKGKPVSNEWNNLILYTTPDNKPYYCPTPNAITILALTPNKIGEDPDSQLFKDLQECGFNAAALWYNELTPTPSGACPQIEIAVNRCSNTPISMFFYTPTLTDKNSNFAKPMVSYYAKKIYNNFVGWYLMTPTYSDIYMTHDTQGIIANAYNEIWNAIRSQEGVNPNRRQIIIMNAFSGGNEANADYRDYLMKFQEKIKPSMWGTAVYPAITFADGTRHNEYDLFFSELEILSLISHYCERPFWYYVRCQSYRTKAGAYTPTPNVEEMRFSAFCALAYGAQGLEYWSYRQRANEPNTTYLEAPVNIKGVRNVNIWKAVKTINEEIKTLNAVFFESYLVKVRHTGNKRYGYTCLIDKNTGFGPIVSIETGNEGVLVSHLNTHGKDYLVIINHVFREGEADSQTVKLTFDHNCTLHKIKAINGSLKETALTARFFEISLPRGGYIIYKWS